MFFILRGCILLVISSLSLTSGEENNTQINITDVNSLPQISIEDIMTWAYGNMQSDPMPISKNTEEQNTTDMTWAYGNMQSDPMPISNDTEEQNTTDMTWAYGNMQSDPIPISNETEEQNMTDMTWAYGNMQSDPMPISNDTEEENLTDIKDAPSTSQNTTIYDNILEESFPTTTSQIYSKTSPSVIKGRQSVIQKTEIMGMVPHIIPTPPRTVANVTYIIFDEKFQLHGEQGDAFSDYILFPKKPKVEFECDPTELYTLFMTYINVTDKRDFHNFNADSMIDAKQYHHWLVYNIPGCNINKGTELFKYDGPKPLVKVKDEYRMYVFLIFKQKKKFFVDLEERTFLFFFRDQTFHNSHRQHFTIEEFADKYDLGDLEAGLCLKQYFPEPSKKFITAPPTVVYVLRYF